MNAWIKWILINATFSSKIVLYSLETQGSGSQKTLHQNSLPSLLSSLHECYTNLIVLQCSSYLQKQKKISNERASTIIICMQQLLMIQPYRFLTSMLWLLAFIPENPIIHKMDTSKDFWTKDKIHQLHPTVQSIEIPCPFTGLPTKIWGFYVHVHVRDSVLFKVNKFLGNGDTYLMPCILVFSHSNVL